MAETGRSIIVLSRFQLDFPAIFDFFFSFSVRDLSTKYERTRAQSMNQILEKNLSRVSEKRLEPRLGREGKSHVPPAPGNKATANTGQDRSIKRGSLRSYSGLAPFSGPTHSHLHPAPRRCGAPARHRRDSGRLRGGQKDPSPSGSSLCSSEGTALVAWSKADCSMFRT